MAQKMAKTPYRLKLLLKNLQLTVFLNSVAENTKYGRRFATWPKLPRIENANQIAFATRTFALNVYKSFRESTSLCAHKWRSLCCTKVMMTELQKIPAAYDVYFVAYWSLSIFGLKFSKPVRFSIFLCPTMVIASKIEEDNNRPYAKVADILKYQFFVSIQISSSGLRSRLNILLIFKLKNEVSKANLNANNWKEY